MARQEKKNRFYESRLSVRPNKVVSYTKVYKVADPILQELLKDCKKARNTPDRTGQVLSGAMSYKSIQRLRDAINILVGTSVAKKLFVVELQVWINFRVNFITLTLPSRQIHTDRDIHRKVFIKFIERWKRSNPKLLYIYKAEKQDNNNLHYHLTTNSFIHHKRLRKWWNSATEKLGYISRATTKDPNSTDVHAVKKVKNLAAYLATYMSKKDKYKKHIKQLLEHKKQKIVLVPPPAYLGVKKHNSILKEVVQIKAWDCSNALLAKPLSIPLQQYQSAAEDIYKTAERVCSYEYVTVAYKSIFSLENTNEIKQDYKKYIAHLVEINSSVNHLLN